LTVYRCAGLFVSSPLELAAPVVDIEAGGGVAPYVEVVEGEVRPVPRQRPSSEVVAERIVNREAWYTFARRGEVVIGRFYGLADFEIAATGEDGRNWRVTFYRAPAAPIGLIAILITGSVVAYLLSADGSLVLHASAVEVNGEALAFIGQSGQGKTTMATILCAEGHALVSDDLLPVGLRGDQVMCVPAGRELRVREKVEALLERFNSRTRRYRTVDERHAVGARTTTAEELPLGPVVVPWPDREATEVTALRLTPGEAVMTLAQYQRIEGWTSPALLRKQFEAISMVVRSVPVLAMRVPWGPPFHAGLADEVLSVVSSGPRVMSSWPGALQ
jgi:hypothetical protein